MIGIDLVCTIIVPTRASMLVNPGAKMIMHIFNLENKAVLNLFLIHQQCDLLRSGARL